MIKPLHKFVLIKKEEKENKTASGIVLSTEKKEVPSIASVIAVGDECTVIDEKDIIAKFE